MSYFNTRFSGAPINYADARQTQQFLRRIDEQEKQRKEKAKALSEDQKRLGMIAQGMGLEKGEVDSMSRGELLGFIDNEMNKMQAEKAKQTQMMELAKFNLDAQKAQANQNYMNRIAGAQEMNAKTNQAKLNAPAVSKPLSPSEEMKQRTMNANRQTADTIRNNPFLMQEVYGSKVDPRMIRSLPDEQIKDDYLAKQKAPKFPDMSTTMREAQKDFEEYRQNKGEEGARQKIESVQTALSRLESGEVETGRLIDFIGETANKLFNGEAVAVKQQLELIFQRNLRDTIGAQFTENEARQFFQRAYDPQLDTEENIAKVKSALSHLIGMANYDIERFSVYQKAFAENRMQDYVSWSRGAGDGKKYFNNTSRVSTSSGNQGEVRIKNSTITRVK